VKRRSPHHLFTSVAFPKPATTAARSMICGQETLVFVFCSHQLTKGLPTYLPTYRWTTLLPLLYQLITHWSQPTYWPFTCMYFHAKSISTSVQYVTLHWKSWMRYKKSDQAASLEECCDPETMHRFQSTGGSVPGEPTVSYMLAEPLCPTNLI